MLRSLLSAESGLRCHQTMLDVIGNNVANVNTPGYKASRTAFSDVYYQTLNSAAGASASGGTVKSGGTNAKQIGYGATVSSIDKLVTRSGYQETDNPTDLYIQGDGYFAVKDAQGNIDYTRVGNFKFDNSGNLVDASGNLVLGATGEGNTLGADVTEAGLKPIQITNMNGYSSIAIGSDGTITATNDSTKKNVTLGQVALCTFANPSGLSEIGSSYLQKSANSGEPAYSAPGSSAKAGSIVTNGLEMSNVDLGTEFTNMIVAQRGYQANARVITTSDNILEELVNLKR